MSWEPKYVGFRKNPPAKNNLSRNWRPQKIPELKEGIEINDYLGYQLRYAGEQRAAFFKTTNDVRPILMVRYSES